MQPIKSITIIVHLNVLANEDKYTQADIDDLLGLIIIISMSSATASSFTRKGEGLHFSAFIMYVEE